MTRRRSTGTARTRLRNRIMLRVGLLVGGLALAFGLGTFFGVRATLIDERETGATAQFATNLEVIQGALRLDSVDEVDLLISLRPRSRARELLLIDGEWYAASLQVQPEDLPQDLLDRVGIGELAMQRFSAPDGELLLAFAGPVTGDDVYVEVFSLTDLQDTLRTLQRTLLGAGVAATALAVAVAWLIARRVSQPIELLGAASERIGRGDLDVRLDGSADRDLGRIASTFNRMADSLQDRIARESRFASDVSHELRSPITTLVNAAAVLEGRRHELSPATAEAVDLLGADVERLGRIVAALTEITKHDAGTVQVETEPVAVADLVHSILTHLGRGDVPVVVTPEASDVVVDVDRERVEWAFDNVVQNADAYAGGLTRVMVDVDADGVMICLDDEGPGVDPLDRERIFDRFARGSAGEARSNTAGSGLGLSLAAENARVTGGDLSVTANPDGRGARFVFRFDREEDR